MMKWTKQSSEVSVAMVGQNNIVQVHSGVYRQPGSHSRAQSNRYHHLDRARRTQRDTTTHLFRREEP